MKQLSEVNVKSIEPLLSPADILAEYPLPDTLANQIFQSRETIKNILRGNDTRLLAIVGPCSIHDTTAAVEYAQKLKKISDEVKDTVFIVMRVYFEKPRTTIGWKGLITDPQVDGRDDIATGLRVARKLLLHIAEIGLSSATEFLDPIVPQYISDLVSWAAIGARTTESQTHRQMASGLSMPVGYKNSTDGNTQVAIDAMISSRAEHSFLGIDHSGRTAIIRTSGNPYGHLILRGGHNLTNYHPESIEEAADALRKANLEPFIMVDCSHANSRKKYEKQEDVWNNIIEQRLAGNKNLIGMMLESNLFPGNQSLPPVLHTNVLNELKYGVSITDACVGWETTEELLRTADKKLKTVQ